MSVDTEKKDEKNENLEDVRFYKVDYATRFYLFSPGSVMITTINPDGVFLIKGSAK